MRTHRTVFSPYKGYCCASASASRHRFVERSLFLGFRLPVLGRRRRAGAGAVEMGRRAGADFGLRSGCDSFSSRSCVSSRCLCMSRCLLRFAASRSSSAAFRASMSGFVLMTSSPSSTSMYLSRRLFSTSCSRRIDWRCFSALSQAARNSRPASPSRIANCRSSATCDAIRLSDFASGLKKMRPSSCRIRDDVAVWERGTSSKDGAAFGAGAGAHSHSDAASSCCRNFCDRRFASLFTAAFDAPPHACGLEDGAKASSHFGFEGGE